jgi:hypothetical protein
MEDNKGYPAYQYSVFLKNGRDEQIVIRADDFIEFMELKKNINLILDKTEKEEPKPETFEESLGTPNCPVCQSTMVKRHGTKGDFWGCTKYPNCKGTRPL